jgi:pimeloyl-ACP methyl ester carboxylesterase
VNLSLDLDQVEKDHLVSKNLITRLEAGEICCIHIRLEPYLRASSDMGQVDGSQLHWVLVHGAMHGAWAYYKTMALLQAEGYKVTAVDLAGCGASAVDPNTVSDFEVLNQPLVDVLNAIPATERVISLCTPLSSLKEI